MISISSFILAIYDIGSYQGVPFVTMELLGRGRAGDVQNLGLAQRLE
jgi:hypothetical protein